MNSKEKLIFPLKIFIPILIIIMLFFTGISVGIITFQSPKLNKNQGEVNVEIIIDFNDGVIYSDVTYIENATVLDLLLKTAENTGMKIEKTYWEQFDSYIIDSITYNGKKYEGSTNSYWAFYVNNVAALEGADKILIHDNDIIKWKFEKI
jgi:hypothetical protein